LLNFTVVILPCSYFINTNRRSEVKKKIRVEKRRQAETEKLSDVFGIQSLLYVSGSSYIVAAVIKHIVPGRHVRIDLPVSLESLSIVVVQIIVRLIVIITVKSQASYCVFGRYID
jgi:hypothetical protein